MKKIILAVLVLSCLAGVAFSQPANCVSPTAISVPFAKDGTGEFCFSTPCLGATINSWNLDLLEINGVNYTNKYCDGVYNCGAWPALMNGLYYIHYKSSVSWGHFEITGSCTGTVTSAPTAVPTVGPTAAPGVGQTWINPVSQTVNAGATVTVDIHVNTGTTALGAFGFNVTYPTNLLTFVSIAEVASGINLTNNTNTAGTIVTAGFNATGVTGSSDIDLIKITFTAASSASGTATVGLVVNNLSNTAGTTIGTPSATAGTVTVNGTVTAAPTTVPTAAPTVGPTAVPPAGVGQTWINPASQTVNAGATVTVDIHVNTGTTALVHSASTSHIRQTF
jgi:hypothetical protein